MSARSLALVGLVAVALLAGGCSGGPRQAGPSASATKPPSSGLATSTSPASASSARATAGGSAAATGPAPAVTIGWVGDTTPGSSMGLPPKNGRALFLQVAEQLQEPDIMAGNLEGTFGSGGKSKSDETGNKGTFSFQAPPAYAESLAWAGFDVMNMANNHAYDYRDPGLASTKKALAAQGIDHTGMSGQITIREANGVRVAFIGTSPYWWSQSLNNIKDTAWLVARAKKKADVVVVIMHAGAEGPDKTATPKGVEMAFGEARGNPRAFSHAMIDAGASLVVGSGPHVVRGIERYKGKLIAYSLGNFAGWSNFSLAGKSALSGLLTVRIDRNGEVLGGQLLPLVLRDPGVPEVDPSGKTLKLVTTLSKQDFKDTFALDAKGDFGPGR